MLIQVADVQIVGETKLSWSRHPEEERRQKEPHIEFEKRIWKQKAHYDEETQRLYVPNSAIHKMFINTCKYVGLKKRGNETYTKHFTAGIMIPDHAYITNRTIDDLKPNSPYVHLEPQKGERSPRGYRYFPELDAAWEASFQVWILDESITQEVFELMLRNAGLFNGLGRWAPRAGGQAGRFSVKKIAWSEIER